MLERYKELTKLCATNSQAGQNGSSPSAPDNLTAAPSACREVKGWARRSPSCMLPCRSDWLEAEAVQGTVARCGVCTD